jgi:hypothetical protein
MYTSAVQDKYLLGASPTSAPLVSCRIIEQEDVRRLVRHAALKLMNAALIGLGHRPLQNCFTLYTMYTSAVQETYLLGASHFGNLGELREISCFSQGLPVSVRSDGT